MHISCKYQTPDNVASYMVDLIPHTCTTILEPCAGSGNLLKALSIKHFNNVTAPTDYFLLDKTKKFDCVIMNPPFSSKSAFLDNAPPHYLDSGMKVGYNILFECMEKSNNVIALMPWYTISDSDVRMRAIVKFGLKSITVLPRKTFNYARIQTCIIELVKGYTLPTEFKTFESLNY